MAELTSLDQDIFLHNIVPYIGGGPSALLELGCVSKFFGARATPDEPSFVETIAREMVCISFICYYLILTLQYAS